MNLQHQHIHALCEELKLPALQAEWSALAQRVADTQGSFADFLVAALEGEQAARLERTRQALLKIATLPAIKSLEGYDFSFATGAPKAQIQELASLSFIERAENIVLLGPFATNAAAWSSPAICPSHNGLVRSPMIRRSLQHCWIVCYITRTSFRSQARATD